MGMWDLYQSRVDAHGGTKRGATLEREYRFLNTKLPDSLSYHTAEIYPGAYGYNITSQEAQEHKITQNVAIINSDNLNEKSIFSLPHEDIKLGSLVYWMENYWLVNERDANTTVYTRAKLIQCNHLLKWISRDTRQIIEQWCVVDDGTKYLTGEYEDRNFFTTRGDSRISVMLARNPFSLRLDREHRFLIDDPETPHKLAYQLTKPLKRGLTYRNEGPFKFVLQEVTATDDDNQELGIADYYRFFPRENQEEELPPPDSEKKTDEKKVWI